MCVPHKCYNTNTQPPVPQPPSCCPTDSPCQTFVVEEKRNRYLLSDYLRIRLQKLQKYPLYYLEPLGKSQLGWEIGGFLFGRRWKKGEWWIFVDVKYWYTVITSMNDLYPSIRRLLCKTTGIINYPHFFHMKAIRDMNILGQIVLQHWEIAHIFNQRKVKQEEKGMHHATQTLTMHQVLSSCHQHILDAGFKFNYVFIFTPTTWGRWTHFDEHIFQMGWFNHQADIGFVGPQFGM